MDLLKSYLRRFLFLLSFILFVSASAAQWDGEIYAISVSSPKKINQNITIQVIVKNTGSETNSYPVEIIIKKDRPWPQSDLDVHTDEIYAHQASPNGGLQSINFSWMPNEEGQYNVYVKLWNYNKQYGTYDEDDSGWFTVQGKIATQITVTSKTITEDNEVTLSGQLTSNSSGLGGKTVKFYINNNYVGSGQTVSSGNVYCDYTPAQSGNHTIKLEFEGDSGYESSSSTGTLTVRSKPSTSISVTQKTITVNREVTLSGQLTSGGSYVSGKTVRFYINNNYIGSEQTNNSGIVYHSYTPSQAGNYTIKLEFDEDSGYKGSSGTNTLIVHKSETAITVNSKTITEDNEVTLSGQLTSNGSGLGGKTVKFYINNSYVGSGQTVSSGNVYCNYTPSQSGSYTIKLEFVGDSDYESNSGTNTLTVRSKPSTSITVEQKTITVNREVTLSGRLTSDGSGLGNKTVNFYINNNYVGSDESTSYGMVYYSYTPSQAGSYTIKLVFEEDSNYKGSSGTNTLTVDEEKIPDLKITSISIDGSSTVQSGNNITVNYTVQNIGEGNANPFHVGFYLGNTQYDVNDNFIAHDDVAALNAGDSRDESFTLTIPENTKGNFFIAGYADYNQYIDEGLYEENNVNGTLVTIFDKQELCVPYYWQEYSDWCWATSLSMILEYYGFEKKPWEIASDWGKAKDDGLKTSLEMYQLDDYLEKNFSNSDNTWHHTTNLFNTNEIKTIICNSVSNNNPVWIGLGTIGKGHAIVITGFTGSNDEDFVYVHDPSGNFTILGNLYHEYTWSKFFNKINEQYNTSLGQCKLVYANIGKLQPNDKKLSIQMLPGKSIQSANLINNKQNILQVEWSGKNHEKGYYYTIIGENNWHLQSNSDLDYQFSKGDILSLSFHITNYDLNKTSKQVYVEVMINDQYGQLEKRIDSEYFTISGVGSPPEYSMPSVPDLYTPQFNSQKFFELFDLEPGYYITSVILHSEDGIEDGFAFDFEISNTPTEFVDFDITFDNPLSQDVISGNYAIWHFSILNSGTNADQFLLKDVCSDVTGSFYYNNTIINDNLTIEVQKNNSIEIEYRLQTNSLEVGQQYNHKINVRSNFDQLKQRSENISLLIMSDGVWGDAEELIIGSISGTTIGFDNNIIRYACVDADFTGTEKIYKITLTETKIIDVDIASGDENLNLFLLVSTNENDCLTWGQNDIQYEAPAGEYYLVVDGYGGVSSDFTLNYSNPDSPDYTASSVWLDYQEGDIANSDLICTDLSVTETVDITYYCALQFNNDYGDSRGGYMGLQKWNALYDKHIHFAIWDPNTSENKLAEVIWKDQDVIAQRFGDEGEGVKCMWPFNWQENHNYKCLIRRWDDGNNTYYQGWFFNVQTSQWKCLATIRANQSIESPKLLNSFLEDFGQTGKNRCAFTLFNGWKHFTDGSWVKLQNAKYSWNGDYINRNASVSNNTFLCETGGDVQGTTQANEILTININGSNPGIGNPSITNVAVADNDGVKVSWAYQDDANLPQFNYQIQIGTDNDWTDAEVWDSGIQYGSDTQVDYTGPSLNQSATYYMRVKVINLYDNQTDWSSASFTLSGNNPPVITSITPTSGDYKDPIPLAAEYTDPDGNETVTQIKYEYSLDGSTNWHPAGTDDSPGNAFSWDSNLDAEVYLRAIAYDGEAWSAAWYENENPITIDNTDPAIASWQTTPSNLTSDHTGVVKVEVTFENDLSGIDAGTVEFNYKIGSGEYAGWDGMSQGSWYYNIPEPSGGWSAHAGETVLYQVRCEDNAGNTFTSTEQEKVIQAAGQTDLTTDLIAYYKFDGNASDAMGNYDGTSNGATIAANGHINQAYVFDGTDDYVSLPDGVVPQTTFSISAWFKLDENASREAIISQWQGGAAEHISFYLGLSASGNNLVWYESGDGTGAASRDLTIETGLSAQTWYHVIIVKNGAQVISYLDGIPAGSSSAMAAALYNYDGIVKVGTTTDNFGGVTPEYFNGVIDEIGLWSRVLTANEVSQVHNGWRPSNGSPEIDVQRPAETSIADGGTDNIGEKTPGTHTLTYTIKNTGDAALSITSVTADASSLVNCSNFTVNTPPPISVDAEGIAALEVAFDVTGEGAFSFDMDIVNNDDDESNYDVHVEGTCVPEDLLSGLISYYKLEGNALDAHGSHHGTVISGTASTDYGIINTGYRCNGQTDEINFPRSTINNLSQGTVSMWVRYFGSEAENEEFIDSGIQGSSPVSRDFRIGHCKDFHTIYFQVGETLFYDDNDASNTDDHAWHHVVVTWDGSHVKFYFDSDLNKSQACNQKIGNHLDYELQIGRAVNNNQGHTQSDYDEIGFWSRALSSNEISNLYNEGNGWTYPSQSGNSAPVLSWTSETGYTNDGVNPDEGVSFEYRVKFSDADGDAPKTGYPKLHVNKSGNPVTGNPFNMDEANTADLTQGRIYNYTLTALASGSDYTYYFEAYDVNDSQATGDPIQSQNGPVVVESTNLLSIQNTNSFVGAQNVQIPIHLLNDEGLSTLAFLITFPTDKVQAVNLEAAGRTTVSVQSGGIDNNNGTANFSVADLSGSAAVPAGDGLIGYLVVNINEGINVTPIDIGITQINNAFTVAGSAMTIGSTDGQIILAEWLVGDVDNDKNLTALDAIFLFRTVTGLLPVPASVVNPNLPTNNTITGYVNQYGDYNTDGFVNALDAIDVFRHATGLPPRAVAKSIAKETDWEASELTFDIYQVDSKNKEVTVGVSLKNVSDLNTFAFHFSYDTLAANILEINSSERMKKDFEKDCVTNAQIHLVAGDLSGEAVLKSDSGYIGFIKMKIKTENSSILKLRYEGSSHCFTTQFNSMNFICESSQIQQAIDLNKDHTNIVPESFSLICYPNPFNSRVSIQVEVPRSGKYDIRIYNIAGQLVKVLNQEKLEAGSYTFYWDGDDSQLGSSGSGIYLCRLTSHEIVKTVRVVYVK